MDTLRVFLSQVVSWFAEVPFPKLGFNILDFVILIVVLFYAYEGYSLGFVLATADLFSFILSFVIALYGYAYVGDILANVFSIPRGFANVIGFFIIALVSEVLLNLLLRKSVRYLPKFDISEGKRTFLKTMNKFYGIIPGLISAIIILSFLFTVIISLPTSPFLKDTVSHSKIGSRLVTQVASVEKALNDVFGGALHDTLNFLTVEPESGESLALHFIVAHPIVDPQAEQEMLRLVNVEREKAGLSPVTMDQRLRILARDYSADMLQRGYFSHYNPEAQSPFDRMDKYGVEYIAAGENLALAPNTDLAMQGLMNSPGHRANILSEDYNKVGIGVMDGGIYGKMYTQEFTN